jgi:hypothetical protein
MGDPFVFSDEDGDYWGAGHIEPSRFVELCRAHDEECGIDSKEEGVDNGGLDPAYILHSYFYQHPEDEERMIRCEPEDTGAEPWTEWRR